jgi:Skp family chaperone for outer membrane proteins
MNAKAFDLERLRAELKLWDAEMAHLEDKVSRLEPEIRTAMQSEAHDMLQAMLAEELARLRQLRDEAEQELQRMEQAGDAEWKIQGERAERALGRLGAAFEQSRARFGE